MSSLKSTPSRIVTNFFFGLNAACKPPRRPHSNTLHALKGQKLLAQGIRPGYSCPHAWRPVGAKALYGDRTSGFASQSILELAMEFCHVNRTMHFLYIRKKNIYLCPKIMRRWTKAYIHIYIIKS